MKILVVEDLPSLLDAISIHLKRHGFAVDAVESLSLARGFFKSSHYDGVFLDLALPDGNGLDFLRELRQQGFRTPVIVMTAKDQISDRIKGLEVGADDYIVKPFDLDEAVARFHAVLRRYQGATSSTIKLGLFESPRETWRLVG